MMCNGPLKFVGKALSTLDICVWKQEAKFFTTPSGKIIAFPYNTLGYPRCFARFISSSRISHEKSTARTFDLNQSARNSVPAPAPQPISAIRGFSGNSGICEILKSE